jgi:hypothetical protein
MGYTWVIHGLCMGYAWVMHGLCMGMHRLPMVTGLWKGIDPARKIGDVRGLGLVTLIWMRQNQTGISA